MGRRRALAADLTACAACFAKFRAAFACATARAAALGTADATLAAAELPPPAALAASRRAFLAANLALRASICSAAKFFAASAPLFFLGLPCVFQCDGQSHPSCLQ
jgi:hypothetical protein